MILEDRGIRKETFLELQNRAVSQTLLAYGSLEQLYTFMHTYSFCTAHKLAKTLRKLADTYNLHLDRTEPRRCLADPFLGSVAHTIVNSVLRDIKHRARIRVPDSWALVGVADEGVTYEKTPGYEGIFTLSQGEVYGRISFPSLIAHS
jgi:RNA-dependent RNA polymerase